MRNPFGVDGDDFEIAAYLARNIWVTTHPVIKNKKTNLVIVCNLFCISIKVRNKLHTIFCVYNDLCDSSA